MDVLDLFVKIGVKDEATDAVEDVSESLVGKLGGAASKAAKVLAGAFAVKKVYDFGRAAFDAYASFEQLQGGVAKLYGNAGMSVEEYAKSVNKSVGQVQDAWNRNERAQKLVMENAQKAWKTAGMDANSYMETATSFSASLINSLKGDTEKAAQLTDVAMRSMSDNINTFGTDAASVQNAFQGFAKQNYTMLDNLKLGYGGTKTEMERLVKDANAWARENGKAADLSIAKFSDVVTAIDYIQQKQGIAGTTMREAMSTIEGSMNAAKAAWSNFVAELGKPDADLAARATDMVDALFGVVNEETGKREGGVIKNVSKEVGTVATNIVRAAGSGLKAGMEYIYSNGPKLVEQGIGRIADSINGMWKNLLKIDSDAIGGGFDLVDAIFGSGDEAGIADKVGSFVDGITDAFSSGWPNVESNLRTLVGTLGNVIGTYGPQVAEVAKRLLGMAASAIAENGPEIAEKVIGIVGDAANAIVENGPAILSSVLNVLSNVISLITSNAPAMFDTIVNLAANGLDRVFELLPKIVEKIPEVISMIQGFFIENIPKLVEAFGQMLLSLGNVIVEHGPEWLQKFGEAIGKLIAYIGTASVEMIQKGRDFMAGIITGSSEEGKNLRKWFADFFPDGLIKGLGDFATMLLDAGRSLIEGLLNGISEVAPDVGKAIRDAFQTVIDFFGAIGEFIQDPIGSIQDGLAALVGASNVAADDNAESMGRIEGDTTKAMESAGGSVRKYDSTKLSDKSAKATVSGNAVDGKGKKSVDDTEGSIKKLSGKSVTVTVNQRGLTASLIDNIRNKIASLQSKEITVTTRERKVKEGGGAWGGIRYHATGGIRIASRWGQGEPLDVVGERGPEAIVPLKSPYGTDFARMMGAEAGKYISSSLGGRGIVNNLYYNGEQSAVDLFDDLTFRMQVLSAMGS